MGNARIASISDSAKAANTDAMRNEFTDEVGRALLTRRLLLAACRSLDKLVHFV